MGEDGVVTAIYDLARVAFEKHFADKFGAYAWRVRGVGEVPGRVEGLGEGKMLLCYDSARDTLRELVGWNSVGLQKREHTERRMVFMNLSMSSGFIKSWHSITPIAS